MDPTAAWILSVLTVLQSQSFCPRGESWVCQISYTVLKPVGFNGELRLQF